MVFLHHIISPPEGEAAGGQDQGGAEAGDLNLGADKRAQDLEALENLFRKLAQHLDG
jgi:hypothetical protein